MALLRWFYRDASACVSASVTGQIVTVLACDDDSQLRAVAEIIRLPRAIPTILDFGELRAGYWHADALFALLDHVQSAFTEGIYAINWQWLYSHVDSDKRDTAWGHTAQHDEWRGKMCVLRSQFRRLGAPASLIEINGRTIGR